VHAEIFPADGACWHGLRDHTMRRPDKKRSDWRSSGRKIIMYRAAEDWGCVGKATIHAGPSIKSNAATITCV
jgi:hypothetical protein